VVSNDKRLIETIVHPLFLHEVLETKLRNVYGYPDVENVKVVKQQTVKSATGAWI